MNNNTRNQSASRALEILKWSVLLVLYQHHQKQSSIVTLEEIRNSLGLPQGRSGLNHLVRGVLEILEVQKYVTPHHFADTSWKITEEEISVFKESSEFPHTD